MSILTPATWSDELSKRMKESLERIYLTPPEGLKLAVAQDVSLNSQLNLATKKRQEQVIEIRAANEEVLREKFRNINMHDDVLDALANNMAMSGTAVAEVKHAEVWRDPRTFGVMVKCVDINDKEFGLVIDETTLQERKK